MPVEEEVLKELKKISKIMLLSNSQQLERVLAEYATNDDRKKIWALINGERQPDEIVRISGLKKSAVYGFLKYLKDSELIEGQHGKPPKRLLDYVPAAWTALIPKYTDERETPAESSEGSTQTEQEVSQNG